MQRTLIATVFSPSRRHHVKMFRNLNGSLLARYTLDGLRVRQLDFVVETSAYALALACAEESLMLEDSIPVRTR